MQDLRETGIGRWHIVKAEVHHEWRPNRSMWQLFADIGKRQNAHDCRTEKPHGPASHS